MRPALSFAGKNAILATMHGKERVIAPLLDGALGVRLRVPAGFDTDRFGTFSREVERAGTQLDAARAKIAAALERDPHASIGVASEGSFGPHPLIPVLPYYREIVVLIDRETGFELVGHHSGSLTNFGHAIVSGAAEAMVFAERIGFPKHGVIVIGHAERQPAPDRFQAKDIETASQLRRAVGQAVERCGEAFVESDMRAHRNPTRMRAIRRATVELVRRYRSACPACGRPGFVVGELLSGLPCAWCGGLTRAIKAEVRICTGCGHRVQRPTGVTRAQPGECAACNP